jgi:hypothetical protein
MWQAVLNASIFHFSLSKKYFTYEKNGILKIFLLL